MGNAKFHKNALIVDENNVVLKATANNGLTANTFSQIITDVNATNGFAVESYRGWTNYVYLSTVAGLASRLIANTKYNVYVRARVVGTVSNPSAYVCIYNETTSSYIVNGASPFSAITTEYQTFYCCSFTTSWTPTNNVYITMFGDTLGNAWTNTIVVDYVEIRKDSNTSITLDSRHIASSSACISHVDFTTSTFDSIGGLHGCNVESPALRFVAGTSATNTDDRYIINCGYSRNIDDAAAYQWRAVEAYRGWDCACILSDGNALKGSLESGKDYYIYVRAKLKGSPVLAVATMGIYNSTTGVLSTIYDANETATNQVAPFTSLTTSYTVTYCFSFRVTWASTDTVFIYFFSNTLDNGAGDTYNNSIIIDYVEVWRSGNEKLQLDFTMNDISGTSLLDCSYHNDTGAIVGNASVVAGPAVGGNALRLDGYTGYITCDNVCHYITGSFSVEGWFRFNSLTAKQCLFGINTSDSNTTAFLLFLNGNTTDGTLSVCYTETTTYVNTSFALALNRWYKILFVLDAVTNYMCLYVDNVLLSSTSGVTTRVQPGYRFSIGQEYDNGAPSDFFNGDIGPFRVYSTVIDNRPYISPESGKNLIDMLERDWRDPSNWTSSPSLSWDPVENALCVYGTGNTYIFTPPIYIDTSKHWYLEATIKRENTATGTFYLGHELYQYNRIANTVALKHQGSGTYDYVGAAGVRPTANVWTTYKNNQIYGRARTGVNQSSTQTFNASPRVTYADILIITNYDNSTPAKYWIKDLKFYYIDPDESGMTRNSNGLLCNPTKINLATNGSFDTGALTPWSMWGTATLTVLDNYSSKMLYVKTDGTVNSGVAKSNISFLGSSTSNVVTVSLDIKVIKFTSGLRMMLAVGASYYQVFCLSSWEKDDKWHRLEYELILPVGVTTFGLYIGGGSGGVSSEFLLDNIEAKKERNYVDNPGGYDITPGYSTPGSYVGTWQGSPSYPWTPDPNVTYHWDTTLHSDAIAVAKWSSGCNPGVPNSNVGYHARWVYGGNGGSSDPCILFQDQNTQYGQAHRWLGIEHALSTPRALGWVPGTVLTISWWQKSTVFNKGARVGIYYHSKRYNVWTFDDCICYRPVDGTNTWEKAAFTYTVTSDWDNYTCSIYIYGMEGEEGLLYVDDVSVTAKNYSLHYALSRRNFLTNSLLEGSIVFSIKTSTSSITRFSNWRQLFRTDMHETAAGARLMLNASNLATFYHTHASYGTITCSTDTLTWLANSTYYIILNFSQSNSTVSLYITDTTNKTTTITTTLLTNWRWDYFIIDCVHLLNESSEFTIEALSFYNRMLRSDEISKLTQSHMNIESNGKITVKTTKERPPCIPSTATYFPFNSTTPKDEYGRISPVTSSNLVMTNHGLFIGSSTTNLLSSESDQNFSNWPSYSGETVTITQLNEGTTRLTGNGVGTSTTKIYRAVAGPSVNGTYYTGSIYVYNISKTVPCIINTNIVSPIPDSNLPATYTILPGDFVHVKLGTVGNGTANFQFNISTPFPTDILDIIAYQPMMSSGTAVCHPFTSSSRSQGTLSYNLYRDMGLQWNQDWSICYWKIPLATSNRALNGYSLERLGTYYANCNISRYLYYGKDTTQAVLLPGYAIAGTSYTSSLYFNKLLFVCLRYDSVAHSITIEWHGALGDIVSTQSLTITEANAYLYDGSGYTRSSDLTFSESNNDYQANALFPFGLVVEQRRWTDTEVEYMRKVSTKIKENTLTNSNIILKGNRNNYITGDIYTNNRWYLIP